VTSKPRSQEDLELDEDRELAQRLSRQRTPYERLKAKLEFARKMAVAETQRARRRRVQP
jgi:hypothetical protein